MTGRHGRYDGEPAPRRLRRPRPRLTFRDVVEGLREIVGEAAAEFALYAAACGVAGLCALGFVFYPRETAAVLAGVLALAAYGAVLMVKASRADAPLPKGRLVVAATVALGLVLLVLYALLYGCSCLP